MGNGLTQINAAQSLTSLLYVSLELRTASVAMLTKSRNAVFSLERIDLRTHTMSTSQDAEAVAAARNFLKATMPLVAIELSNRIPGESSFRDSEQQLGAQSGALIETWSIRAASYLTRHLVLMNLAEYCFDDNDCSSIRLLVPFEHISGHIAAQDDKLILDRFLSVIGPRTYASSRCGPSILQRLMRRVQNLLNPKRINHFPPSAAPSYPYNSTEFEVYCHQLTRYIREFFLYEKISRNAPISQRFEVDLITEFYVLCSYDAFSTWAVKLASEVDEANIKQDEWDYSPYAIETVQLA